MTISDLQSGESVFVDSNIFVYAFAPEPQFGPASEQLLERIERNDVHGFTSVNVLSDVAHRLMALEACSVFGWPYAGIAQQLKRHPLEVRQLSRYSQAVQEIVDMGFQIVAAASRHVTQATAESQTHGLLSNDALILVLMHENGISHLASNDADFDRVPGITRYAPL
jgi:predicted nucleic acid-binding protein